MQITAIGLAVVWLSAYWIKQSEIVSIACQSSGAVPSVPALAMLLLVLVVNPLLRRTKLARPVSLGESVLLYCIVSIGVMMYGVGGMRHLMAAMTEHVYLSTPAEPTARLAEFIPSWLAPNSAETIRGMYEGSPRGTVPWDQWLAPVLAWALFFLLLGGTILGLLVALAGRWLDEERLTFPLARMPLELLGAGTIGPFFRSPLAWVGIGIATLLNVINMVRGVFFGGPSYGEPVLWLSSLNLGYPWAALDRIPLVALSFKPILVGLGYLVSNDVSISIIFFFILTKAITLVIAIFGNRDQEAPYAREQSMGGYLALALSLIWARRHALRAAVVGARVASGDRTGASDPAVRWGLLLGLVCYVGVLTFLVSAGMTPWLAVYSTVILVLVSISYARVRADTGIPLNWVRPYTLEYRMVWYSLGGRPITHGSGGIVSATVLALTSFLSRTGFTSASGHQIEGIMLCRKGGVSLDRVSKGILLAIGVGILGGFFVHLRTFYAEGATMLPGGTWGHGFMRRWYADVLRNWDWPDPIHVPKTVATVAGAGATLLISSVRMRVTGLPLHPVGFLVANTEYACWLFPSFLVTYGCKSLIMRYGGHRLYQRAMPLFLGLAVGHVISGGLVWGALSATLGGPFMRWSAWVN